MIRTMILPAAVSAGLMASAASAQILDGDVHLTIEGGQLRTGLIAEDDSYVYNGIRAFYGELGLDLPNTAADPGFKAEPGTFTPGTLIGFNFTRALHVWNGTNFDAIAGSTMTMSFATESFTTPATDVFTPGFTIPVDPTGEFHHHPTFVLNSPASDGIYLLDVSLTGTGLASAPPIWMLWNQNMDVATAETAYDYALANVPAPTGFAVGAAGMTMALRRRRYG